MVSAAATLTLANRGDTRRLGRRLGQLLAPGDLIVLEGDLGAGKTFLSRAVARGLGVPPQVRVASPTFALVHELEGRLPLLHVDLYRLSDPSELEELGIFERLGRDAAALIEWGGRFADDLGPDRLEISLVAGAGSVREACFRATGPRSSILLSELLSEA